MPFAALQRYRYEQNAIGAMDDGGDGSAVPNAVISYDIWTSSSYCDSTVARSSLVTASRNFSRTLSYAAGRILGKM